MFARREAGLCEKARRARRARAGILAQQKRSEKSLYRLTTWHDSCSILGIQSYFALKLVWGPLFSSSDIFLILFSAFQSFLEEAAGGRHL